jgi:hypothetical protein
MWWVYFVYLYENVAMNSIETVLKRGGEMRENDGGGEYNYDTL